MPEAKPGRILLATDLEKNSLFIGTDRSVSDAVIANGSLIEVELRQRIYRPEQPIADVYFPTTAVLSIVTQMDDGSSIEVGTIGREGMSAFPLIMGATTTANDCYCQVPGEAIVMSIDAFRALADNESFQRRLDRYLQAYVNMLGQLAACNRLHRIYQRCARWLLMTHDRVGSDEIQLTHEYLAMMLGTGRSGVTIAARRLQEAGLISYGNGIITVVDRHGLEGAACECYRVARTQFQGLFREPSTRPARG